MAQRKGKNSWHKSISYKLSLEAPKISLKLFIIKGTCLHFCMELLSVNHIYYYWKVLKELFNIPQQWEVPWKKFQHCFGKNIEEA